MARSYFKEPFIEGFLSKKIQNKKTNQRNLLWTRRSTILPENVGHRWRIHNGKNFINLHVVETMIGHKFGEFALTRRRGQSKKKKKK